MGEARHYSMLIQWSDEDEGYIVTVPELPGCRAHGEDRLQAIKNVLEVIDLWIESAEKDGMPIPPPRYYDNTHE